MVIILDIENLFKGEVGCTYLLLREKSQITLQLLITPISPLNDTPLDVVNCIGIKKVRLFSSNVVASLRGALFDALDEGFQLNNPYLTERFRPVHLGNKRMFFMPMPRT